MLGVDILIEEHKNILKFVDIVRAECKEVLEGKDVDIARFREFLDFGRRYADHHHHGKEEEILFKKMSENLGKVGEVLIKNGMLVEHDLGRLTVSELERHLNSYEESPNIDDKLDIITCATSYGQLLARHIEKEDTAVYQFAIRQFDEALAREVDEETIAFNNRLEEAKIKFECEEWVKKNWDRS